MVPAGLLAAGPLAGLAICQGQRAVTCRGPLHLVPSLKSSEPLNRFFGAGWNDAGADLVFMIRNHSEGTFELRKGMDEELYNPPQRCNL